MNIREFIRQLEGLGYECGIGSSEIKIFLMYGKNLRQTKEVGRISIKVPYAYSLKGDLQAINDGVYDLIEVFAKQSLKERGRLSSVKVKSKTKDI